MAINLVTRTLFHRDHLMFKKPKLIRPITLKVDTVHNELPRQSTSHGWRLSACKNTNCPNIERKSPKFTSKKDSWLVQISFNEVSIVRKKTWVEYGLIVTSIKLKQLSLLEELGRIRRRVKRTHDITVCFAVKTMCKDPNNKGVNDEATEQCNSRIE